MNVLNKGYSQSFDISMLISDFMLGLLCSKYLLKCFHVEEIGSGRIFCLRQQVENIL